MKKVVATIPCLLQEVLSFTASRRSFSLSRVSKLGSAHGSQDTQNPKRAALDVSKFINDCEKKSLSANKMVIGPSNACDIEISTKLVGAAIGVEGMKVFPPVFEEKYPWKPSESLLDAVKPLILRFRSKANVPTVSKCTAAAEESVLGPTASIVPELLSLICNDAGAEKHVSLLRDVSFSAGWPVAGMWIQVNCLADVYRCNSPAHGPLEPSLFTSAEILPLSAEEIASLHSDTPETTSLEFDFPAKDCALKSSCVPVLSFDPAARGSIQDSRALLCCAATMINQILASNSSERRTGYSILTDGHTWRFVAVQLNTLDFDAALNVPGAVKNAAWVYESQLYTVTGDDITVDPEVLGILHHVFNMDKVN